MARLAKSLHDTLIVAVVQTLLFGIILALFGYWLNHRLETYKQALADQFENRKVLLSLNEPLLQQRHAAYLEFQQAAREARNVLRFYYSRAVRLPSQATRSQLRILENDLGVRFGMGASSGWATRGDAISVIRKLMLLRVKYEDVSSDTMNSSIDDFIDTLMQDLRDSPKESNDTGAFDELAREHLLKAFDTLNAVIDEALGRDRLPIQ